MAERRRREGEEATRGVSRRGFLTSVGAGAAYAAVLPGAPPPALGRESAAGEATPVTLTVNGRPHRVLVPPQRTLLGALRDELGLTGTKMGCERGECGACTVLIDGVPRYACLTLALEAGGHEITTVEGVMNGEELGPVQKAFVQEDGFQCGYCTPGMVMAAEGLLRARPDPSLDEIRQGVSGNLCRCGAYAHVFNAVRRAAELRKAGR